MVSRFLEKKVEIECDEFHQRPNSKLELEYYLLEREGGKSGDNESEKTFGIEILKKNDGVLNETKQYENIFNTREKTKGLVKLLAENTVTPSTLPYILDDLLGM
ncbi:MAG: DUF6514 family protein [Clostridiaceae bacterium]